MFLHLNVRELYYYYRPNLPLPKPCVCSQDTKRTQKAFWSAPRSIFWRKDKRQAAKPARSPGDLQGECQALPNQPSSCPRLEVLTTPLWPYSCPNGSQFALLDHLKIPDCSGYPRKKRTEEVKIQYREKKSGTVQKQVQKNTEPSSNSTQRSWGPCHLGLNQKQKLFLHFTHFHAYPHSSLPQNTGAEREKGGCHKNWLAFAFQ